MTDEAEASPKRTVRTYKVKRLVDPEQLKKDQAYSITNLSDAMQQQASLFAHYGMLAAEASHQVDSLKLLIKNVEAKVYRKLRDQAAAEGVKTTEAQLEKSVAVDPQVVAFEKALNEAKQIEAVCKIAVESFRHRRDMLVQEGATSREEMKGELSIRRREVIDESLEDQKRRMLERIQADASRGDH